MSRYYNRKEKFYVGSSVDLSKRFLCYFNTKYLTKHKDKSIIYSVLLKKGYKVFNLEILEYCDIKNVIKREQFYIDTLKPKYNILKYAASSLGFKHSDTTKLKMSINNTKENHPFFGKKHTEESRIKMSMSKPAKMVKIINIKKGTEKTFGSSFQAAKYLNVSD